MMSEIKILAIDLDGTLFDSNSVASERSVAAVQRCIESGFHVAIATARPVLSVRRSLDERLHEGLFWICSGGASIYRDGQRIYSDTIDADTAQRCVELLYAWPWDLVVSMEMASSGKLFINRELDTGSVPFEVADLRSIRGEVTRFLVTAPEEPQVRIPHLPSQCRVEPIDGGLAVNITSASASKATAMSALLERMGFGYDCVMAFGNDVNDLDLLNSSAVAIAMGNAVSTVRDCADRIALSNEEDGVAVVLEELLEGGAR